MAKKADPKDMVTFQEISYSNMITQESLINLLAKKGLISKEELLEEIKAVNLELKKKQGQ